MEDDPQVPARKAPWQHGEDEGETQRQRRMLVRGVPRRVPLGQSRGVGVSQSS